jgi:hypothetical protein
MSDKNKKELEILKWTIISYIGVNLLLYSIWLIVDYFINGLYGNTLAKICEAILILGIYRMAKEYQDNNIW